MVRLNYVHLISAFVLLCVPASFASPSDRDFQAAVEAVKTVDWGQDQWPMDVIDAEIQKAGHERHRLDDIEKSLLSVLKSDATFAARQFVCRRLAHIGTEQSVDVLGALLTDVSLSHMARYALEKIPGSRAEKVLVQALEKTEGDLQIGIINSLGRRRSGFDKIALLTQSRDRDVAKSAINALGTMGTEKAGRLLLEQITEVSDNALYRAYVEAMLKVATQASREDGDTFAVKLYEYLYESGRQEHIQLAGFLGLMTSRPDLSVELLDAALTSPADTFNRVAGRYLALSDDVSLLQSYMRQIDQLPSSGQIAVLGAIADREYAAGYPVIIESLQHEDALVRIAALDALAVVGTSDDILRLAETAVRAQGAEKLAARRALRQLDQADIEARMTAMLESAEPLVQVEIIEVLNFKDARNACDIVIQYIDHEHPAVSAAALRMLADLGDIEHLPTIVNVLRQADQARLLSLCERTLQRIAARNTDEALPMILAHARQAAGQPRYTLLRVAASMHHPEALELVLAALGEEDAESKTAAIRILSAWRDHELLLEYNALDALLAVAKTDPESRFRILALQSYINQIRQLPLNPAEKLTLLQEAMAIAERDRETMMVVSALGDVALPASLEHLLSLLENDALALEARAAVLNWVENSMGAHSDISMNALQKVLVQFEERDDAVMARAETLLEQLKRYQGRLLYEHEFSADKGGWIPENHVDISLENEALKIEIDGHDPHISSPLDLPGGEIEVHLQVKAGPTTTWQMFWGSSTKDIYAEPFWFTNFEVPPGEDQWQSVIVPIAVDGRLTRLRIDPGQGSEVVLLNHIRILRSEQAAAGQTVMYNPSAQTRVLLIASPLDHPFGTHMYAAGCELLADCLRQTEGVDAAVSMGWPTDGRLLEDIDAIVLYSSPAPAILLDGDHAQAFRELMSQGVGLVALHWSTGNWGPADDAINQEFMEYLGGLWSPPHSGLDMLETVVTQLKPEHPICSGWRDYLLYDEIYLRTQIGDQSVPVMSVDVHGTEEVVAWVYERPGGGRSYGNTLGHFHHHFWVIPFTRGYINGILWAAGHPVPDGGASFVLAPEDMLLQLP